MILDCGQVTINKERWPIMDIWINAVCVELNLLVDVDCRVILDVTGFVEQGISIRTVQFLNCQCVCS